MLRKQRRRSHGESPWERHSPNGILGQVPAIESAPIFPWQSWGDPPRRSVAFRHEARKPTPSAEKSDQATGHQHIPIHGPSAYLSCPLKIAASAPTRIDGRRSHRPLTALFLLACLPLLLNLLANPPAAAQDIHYRFERMWPTLQQPWYFNHNEGIAIDPESDSVYITNRDRVDIFSPDGFFKSSIKADGPGPDSFDTVVDVAVASEAIYILDRGYRNVKKFGKNMAFITTWGETGSGPLQFLNPMRLAIGHSENLYVADTLNHRVQVLDQDGNLVHIWGTFGSEDYQFDTPHGICVDDGGEVYVADTNNHRIQVFTPEGVHIRTFGSVGTGLGQLRSPVDLCTLNSSLYVVELLNARLQEFTLQGVPLGVIPLRGHEGIVTVSCKSVAVHPKHGFFVSDSFDGRTSVIGLAGF